MDLQTNWPKAKIPAHHTQSLPCNYKFKPEMAIILHSHFQANAWHIIDNQYFLNEKRKTGHILPSLFLPVHPLDAQRHPSKNSSFLNVPTSQLRSPENLLDAPVLFLSACPLANTCTIACGSTKDFCCVLTKA